MKLTFPKFKNAAAAKLVTYTFAYGQVVKAGESDTEMKILARRVVPDKGILYAVIPVVPDGTKAAWLPESSLTAV